MNGWSDAQRRLILNFMASTRAAAAFLKSVNCTDHIAGGGKKDAVHIAANVTSAEDVVQFVMDGANKSTWPIKTKSIRESSALGVLTLLVAVAARSLSN